jgi:SAM-dependent MidA family methyltransferase
MMGRHHVTIPPRVTYRPFSAIMALPEPDNDARQISQRLRAVIDGEIRANDGWLPFSRYMDLALYFPGMGYYAGGSVKFGSAGDFITAPEISPLFARALATQIVQVMEHSAPAILEVGAGSGVLAAELLLELERRGALPKSYAMLELSGELAMRQRQTLTTRAPHLLDRISWLGELPLRWSGVVLGNELLDALPVAIVEWREDGIAERGIVLTPDDQLAWESRPARGPLLDAAAAIVQTPLYTSEIGLAGQAWIAEWGARLECGAVILVDYGFPRHEYYHPQRSDGTLMCHYRRHAHHDPLWWPGLCDITAHVDFTTIAESAFAAGLDVLGYIPQAAFLMNCGLLELLGRVDPNEALTYLPAARAVDKLINIAEMGELFKVIAVGRGLDIPLVGFSRGDRLASL